MTSNSSNHNRSSHPNSKLTLRDRIEIAFSLAASTARRARLHPVLLLTAILLAIALGFALWHFNLLFKNHQEASALFRDLVLIAAAAFAVPLALSRTLTAERALLNERYQRAAEMIGSDIRIVRLAAVFALQRLSLERSEDYHVDVVKLLSSFIRERTGMQAQQTTIQDLSTSPSVADVDFETGDNEEVSAALDFLKNRDPQQTRVEALYGLTVLDLSYSHLAGADLTKGEFRNTNFSGANLVDADLSGAKLDGCLLANTDLSSADLSFVTGLRQETLDKAIARADSPPRLGRGDTMPRDPATGRRLRWNA